MAHKLVHVLDREAAAHSNSRVGRVHPRRVPDRSFFGVLLKKGITVIIFGVIIVVIILITGLAIPTAFSQLLGFGISALQTIINDFSILIPIEGLFFFVGLALGFWKG